MNSAQAYTKLSGAYSCWWVTISVAGIVDLQWPSYANHQAISILSTMFALGGGSRGSSKLRSNCVTGEKSALRSTSFRLFVAHKHIGVLSERWCNDGLQVNSNYPTRWMIAISLSHKWHTMIYHLGVDITLLMGTRIVKMASSKLRWHLGLSNMEALSSRMATLLNPQFWAPYSSCFSGEVKTKFWPPGASLKKVRDTRYKRTPSLCRHF